jgi:Meiotically Up-regulated Gene 113 (MUG113) protein/regulatory GntR family protein
MTVYVIGCEGSHLVKIGHTGNPAKRLSEIRSISPHPLTLLWQSGPEHNEESERKLHYLFRDYRQHGEWFAFGEADPVALIAAAITLPKLPPKPLKVIASERPRQLKREVVTTDPCLGDHLERRPPYDIVAEQYRDAIRTGRLSMGEQMPSTIALAREWSVAKSTAQRVLELLRDEGWITSRSGRPPVVKGVPPTKESTCTG